MEQASGWHVSISRADGLFALLHERAKEFVNGHESFLALSNRGALSILDDSFKLARAYYLDSGEPWSTLRIEQRASGRIICLFRSDWSLHRMRAPRRRRGMRSGFAFAEGPEGLVRAVTSCEVVCESLSRTRPSLRRFFSGVKAHVLVLSVVHPNGWFDSCAPCASRSVHWEIRWCQRTKVTSYLRALPQRTHKDDSNEILSQSGIERVRESLKTSGRVGGPGLTRLQSAVIGQDTAGA